MHVFSLFFSFFSFRRKERKNACFSFFLSFFPLKGPRGPLKGPTPGFLAQFFGRPEIVDFWGVWAARGGRETFQKAGGRSPPPFWKLSRPPGAAQTPKIDDFRSVKKSCVRNLEGFLLSWLRNRAMVLSPGGSPRTPPGGSPAEYSLVLSLKGPRGHFKGPRDPFKAPRGPLKGPRGPFKGPGSGKRTPGSPLKGPRGPFKGPGSGKRTPGSF